MEVEQQKAGRRYLGHKGLYFTLLALIGLAAYPLNATVFVLFRQSEPMTIWMSSTLLLLIPLSGHFAGRALKRRNQTGPAGKVNWRIFITLTILIVTYCGALGVLQVNYVDFGWDWDLQLSAFWISFLAGMVPYGIAALASYGHHALLD